MPQEGKTTKSELRAMLGPPTSMSRNADDLEVWSYDTPSGVQIPQMPGAIIVSVFTFDKKGVLKQWALREAFLPRKTGLIDSVK